MTRVTLSLVLALLIGSVSAPAQRKARPQKAEKPGNPVTQIDQLVGPEPDKWGIIAVRLRDDAVIYSHNPDVLMQPASNQKVFTTATAIDLLGPQWTTRTSVYSQRSPGNGVLDGDLILYGRGDPNLSGRFNEEDPILAFRALADELKAAGVNRVAGSLVADDSYFFASPFGAGWSSEDLQWWFGAEVSALSFNDNLVTIEIAGGAKQGDPCSVKITPDLGYVEVQNDSRTGGPAKITVHRELDSSVIDIGGTLPVGKGWGGSVSVYQPALYAAAAFRRALSDAGIQIDGPTKRLGPGMLRPAELEIDRLVELASLESQPLGELIRTINKRSQNLHAEMILRLLGRVKGTEGEPSDAEGARIITTFLQDAGGAVDGMRISDGSGLSRLDRVSARMLALVATVMDRHEVSGSYRHSLPVAGVDGTLRGRLSGLTVYAKTGSLDSAKSLSGYMTTKSGERLAFAIVYNDERGTGSAIGKIDRIAAMLAGM